MEAFEKWLRTSHAYDVLDDAVLGCLDMSVVSDLCADFGIDRATFRRCLDAALREGN